MAKHYRATDTQIAYLRRLLDEAFSHRIASGFDRHHLDRVTSQEASTEITRLKALKTAGWK